jgi:pseudouridine-5'-phosphate glycosidase/pseudouridine kinase
MRLLQQCGRGCLRSTSPASWSARILSSKLPRRFQSTKSQYDPKIFQVSEEVRDAVATGKPVVALETTIYTHGFPYPDNVALATHLESVVRQNGGVPATIGVLSGVARVGLNAEEVIQIASAAGRPETMKVSRRDLPFITGLVCVLLVLFCYSQLTRDQGIVRS